MYHTRARLAQDYEHSAHWIIVSDIYIQAWLLAHVTSDTSISTRNLGWQRGGDNYEQSDTREL